MKRLPVVLATAATALAATAAPAAAADITVSSILCADNYKSAWVPAGSAGDANGNGAVCVKGKRRVDEIRIVTVTVSAESGGCPTPYLAVAAITSPDYDANQNAIVCYDPSGKGTWTDDLALITDISIQ